MKAWAGDNHPGGSVPLQPTHRSEPGLQPSVVSLERVVAVDLRVMEGRRQQLVEDSRVDPIPVGGDLDGRDPGPADRPLEEPACRLGVPAR